MNFRFSLLGLIGLTTLAGMASAALAKPSAEWLTVIVSLVVAIAILQVLRAILFPGPDRVSAVGWLVFVAGYLAVALGPIASQEIGSNLLTTRALGYAQVRWHKVDPSSFAPVGPQPSSWIGAGSAMTLWVDYLVTDVSGSWQGPGAVVPAPNHFLLAGHWFTALAAGWVGSVLARQLNERQRSISHRP